MCFCVADLLAIEKLDGIHVYYTVLYCTGTGTVQLECLGTRGTGGLLHFLVCTMYKYRYQSRVHRYPTTAQLNPCQRCPKLPKLRISYVTSCVKNNFLRPTQWVKNDIFVFLAHSFHGSLPFSLRASALLSSSISLFTRKPSTKLHKTSDTSIANRNVISGISICLVRQRHTF